jgi:hypothetical protein
LKNSLVLDIVADETVPLLIFDTNGHSNTFVDLACGEGDDQIVDRMREKRGGLVV